MTRRGFPLDRYTPHGYIDNPRHSWRLGRSGVLRASGGIGLAWHYPSYPGPYGKRWVYEASLRLDVDADSELHADYHSKDLLRFRQGDVTVEMFLDADVIVARVAAPAGRTVRASAAYRRQLGVSGDWDFGLLARHDPDQGMGHLATYAEGTAFALLADQSVASAECSSSDADWPDRSQPVEKHVSHLYVAPEGPMTVVLARAESSDAASARARKALLAAEGSRQGRLRADRRFWSNAPRLEGDWPNHWRRGFVYDLETLRAIVRPAAGVYRSRWDGMQIQVPRVVLAETALDMLLLSYADPATAKEVVLGTFRDAIAPNVPCTREDGSVNMVAVDGSACGTSPAWCWPFWCIGLLYRRTADRAWLAKLLPHAESFLDWWLEHRAGPFYLCGWESGQDASPRFNAERGGGGIERIRPVDLIAALAQAARLLGSWNEELGRDGGRWRAIADEYSKRTRGCWFDGWFHDLTEDGPTEPRDPMQLAPLMCRVAAPEQVAALSPRIAELPSHGEYSPLEWPPVALTALESALQGGEASWAASAAAGLVDRVWRETDAPRHEPGHPLPGVAHEHWPPEGEWHTEGYGWGAATVLLFLRYVAGIQDDPESDDLRIQPRFPPDLMREGATYRVTNLPWQGRSIDLTYRVEDGSIRVERTS